MLLDLRGFRGEVDRVARTWEPGAFDLAGEDFRLTAPVEVSAELHKDAQKVRLVGRLKTKPESWRDYFFDDIHGAAGS